MNRYIVDLDMYLYAENDDEAKRIVSELKQVIEDSLTLQGYDIKNVSPNKLSKNEFGSFDVEEIKLELNY